MTTKNKSSMPARGVRRIPQHSVLYDWVVPIALIGMTAILGLILLIAAAILVGIIHW